jgi:hypothetical protein
MIKMMMVATLLTLKSEVLSLAPQLRKHILDTPDTIIWIRQMIRTLANRMSSVHESLLSPGKKQNAHTVS